MDTANTPEETRNTLHYLAKCLLKPLDHFRTQSDRGEELFQYLFYNRNPNKKKIAAAISSMSNITIVGNPGQGKSSLMRYMCIEFSKSNSELLDGEYIYPVILDWRYTAPKEVVGLLTDFCEQMRNYFAELKHPCSIAEDTTLENCREHFRIITNHLQKLNRDTLTRKLVIFIDDMDYAENHYMEILKTYFLNYAASDKAVVVLSCRKPLLNSIREDDQLRQCYHIQPQHIHLNDMDIESLLYHRLRALLQNDQKTGFLCGIVSLFRKKDLDDILKQYANDQGVDIENLDSFKGLPFNNSFYSDLYEITHGNLRDIEELLPQLCKYHEKGESPSFHDCFITAYIENTSKNRNLLLDLITQRSSGKKKKEKGNSILQNVLEYFYFNELKNSDFESVMLDFGISAEDAHKAVLILSKTPYDLIDPSYIYSVSSSDILHERYLINNKGRIYVKQILRCDDYYSKRKLSPSERSYFDENTKLLS